MRNKTLSPQITQILQKHGLSLEQAPIDQTQWANFILSLDGLLSDCNESRLNLVNDFAATFSEIQQLEVAKTQSNAVLLKDLNENMSLILQASDLGTWDWNLETNYVNYDKRWCEIIGYSVEETPQRFETFQNGVHPDDIGGVINLANDYISGKVNKFEVKFRMLHKKGFWVSILAKGKIMKVDSQGKPLRFMGTHLDISEEVRIQKEIEDQKVKLLHNSKLASLGEMSAGIAHEINNPLAIIMGSVGLLNKFKDNPVKFQAKIDSISKSCVRISKILNGLKKFSRSAEKTERKPHDLREIINEVVTLIEIKSSQSHTPITFNCTGDSRILCDESEIEQVLINLINNAIDAVKFDDERWVKIESFSQGNKIFLRVIDSGKSISPEVEKKLFEPFFTTKRVGEGTGLGLSISKGIIDDHNATISLNRNFENTCFEIIFNKLEA
jgi:PAS domain S-box-containing protein